MGPSPYMADIRAGEIIKKLKEYTKRRDKLVKV